MTKVRTPGASIVVEPPKRSTMKEDLDFLTMTTTDFKKYNTVGCPYVEREMTTSYDYIIVGAGPSAMGLLLGLLEPYVHDEDQNWHLPFSVAIIERGPPAENDMVQQNLNRWFEVAHDRSSSHVSLLSTSVSARNMDVPVGRGVGGGSNINAGLCIAPPSADFHDWPNPWRTELPASIRKLQHRLAANHCLCDAATGDKIVLENLSASTSMWDNDSAPISDKGSAPHCRKTTVPCLARHTDNSLQSVVERVNYYQGLIEPLLRRMPEQINWFYNTEAQRLLFDDNDCQKVAGVEIMNDNRSFTSLFARKEVILCGGAIETPALLLVSGIGTPIRDGADDHQKTEHHQGLQGIGQNLRDHVILPRVLLGPPPFWRSTINGIHNIHATSVGNHKYLILTSTTTPEIALRYMTEVFRQYWFCMFATNWISRGLWQILERILRFWVLYSPAYIVMKYGFTTINLALVNPHSKGSLSLEAKSGESVDHNVPRRRKDFDIQLDLGYVQHSEDVEALWQGWVASPVVQDPHAFDQKWEVYPGGIFRFLYWWFGSMSKGDTKSRQSTVPNWFSQYAIDHCLPFFHWFGTCAMKISPGSEWVVDADMRVRSFRSLRVCDASTIPSCLLAPPALTCAAMGHLLALSMTGQEQ